VLTIWIDQTKKKRRSRREVEDGKDTSVIWVRMVLIPEVNGGKGEKKTTSRGRRSPVEDVPGR